MKNYLSRILLAVVVMVFAFTACKDDKESLPQIKAQFEVSSQALTIDEVVKFTNYSVGASSQEWFFGDGETSIEENPEHAYTDGGRYAVKLVIDVDGIRDSVEKVIIVSEFAYVVNYGGYTGEKTTISLYDLVNDEVTNGYYTQVNGTHMVSNAQSAYNYMGKVYFMGNNVDQIYYVDAKSFKQTNNGITEDVKKPRHCVGYGDYLYVSCWGGDIWEDTTLSYIAKIDINTQKVVAKIALAGGAEDLAVANGKLYAALNYDKKIAVIKLSDESISYINTPAASSYFIKDANENLYVSLVGTYSMPTTEDGIGYIDTSSDQLTIYKHSGISSSYVNIMEVNKDFSKLYVMTSAYDASWNLLGAVSVFDLASKEFESDKFVEGLTGLNGISVNSITDNVYCFISPSTTAVGKILIYNEDGVFQKEVNSGIAPSLMFEID